MKKLYIAAATLLLLTGHPASAASVAAPDEYIAPSVEPQQAFTIELPKGCTLTESNTKMDFEILRVLCDQTPVVGIYAGNAANIGDSILKSENSERSIILKASDPDQIIRGYLLHTEYAWPAQLHVWIMPTLEENTQAQAIAASVRPTHSVAATSATAPH